MPEDQVSWKDYVDAIFVEHREQVQAALLAHDTKVLSAEKSASEKVEALRREMLTSLGPGQGVDLRTHIEAIFSEHKTALDAAERERIRVSDVVSDNLERLVAAGDSALRSHIAQQAESTDAALASVDRRMTSTHAEMVLRDSSVRDALVAETKSNDVRVREAFAASEKAIQKAEAASDKRFDGVNAFREQLADQAAQFLPREVADTQFNNLLRRIEANAETITGVRGAFVTRETFDTRVDEMTKQITRLTEAVGKLT